MIADYKNPHGKPTKQLNSIEFLLEQVVKGTYEYGEDKILHTTLPKAMIDHALAMHREEHQKTYNQGLMSNFQDFNEYYNQTFGGNNE